MCTLVNDEEEQRLGIYRGEMTEKFGVGDLQDKIKSLFGG